MVHSYPGRRLLFLSGDSWGFYCDGGQTRWAGAAAHTDERFMFFFFFPLLAQVFIEIKKKGESCCCANIFFLDRHSGQQQVRIPPLNPRNNLSNLFEKIMVVIDTRCFLLFLKRVQNQHQRDFQTVRPRRRTMTRPSKVLLKRRYYTRPADELTFRYLNFTVSHAFQLSGCSTYPDEV